MMFCPRSTESHFPKQMVWSQDFQLPNPHSYRHISRKTVSETFQKCLKALSFLWNVSRIKRLVQDLNRTHCTSQVFGSIFASMSYLGLHCPGNFISLNDFKETLGVPSFYPTIRGFDTCSQKYTVWSKSPQPVTQGSKGLHHLHMSLFVQILGHDTAQAPPECHGSTVDIPSFQRGSICGIHHNPKALLVQNQRGKPSSELCWDSIWNKALCGFV